MSRAAVWFVREARAENFFGPLSVARPIAASASFCVYGSWRKARSLLLSARGLAGKRCCMISKSGNGTFFCDSSPSYAALSLCPRRSTLHIRRSKIAPSLADPQLPLLICTVLDVWWIEDQHGSDRDPLSYTCSFSNLSTIGSCSTYLVLRFVLIF